MKNKFAKTTGKLFNRVGDFQWRNTNVQCWLNVTSWKDIGKFQIRFYPYVRVLWLLFSQLWSVLCKKELTNTTAFLAVLQHVTRIYFTFTGVCPVFTMFIFIKTIPWIATVTIAIHFDICKNAILTATSINNLIETRESFINQCIKIQIVIIQIISIINMVMNTITVFWALSTDVKICFFDFSYLGTFRHIFYEYDVRCMLLTNEILPWTPMAQYSLSSVAAYVFRHLPCDIAVRYAEIRRLLKL